MTIPTLLPCPHCGGQNLRGPYQTKCHEDCVHDPLWFIECWDCPASMELVGKTPERLVTAWNRRPGQRWWSD